MRVLDTVSGLVEMGSRLRRTDSEPPYPAPGGPLGQLETRLAGVLVAALKEAFDRDRARMDLERTQMDAERQRAEEALRAELRRQAAERTLGLLRMIAIMAFAALMVSAVLGVWVPGMRLAVPRALLGVGWGLAIASLGFAFVEWRRVSAWSSDTRPSPYVVEGMAAAADVQTGAAPALWLLLGSLALTLASLLFAL